MTTNFFNLSGARILYGRDFNQDDGIPQPQAPQNAVAGTAPAELPQVAILSYEYFQRRYGGNQAVIGHTMQFSGRPGPLIAGVLARDSGFTSHPMPMKKPLRTSGWPTGLRTTAKIAMDSPFVRWRVSARASA